MLYMCKQKVAALVLSERWFNFGITRYVGRLLKAEGVI